MGMTIHYIAGRAKPWIVAITAKGTRVGFPTEDDAQRYVTAAQAIEIFEKARQTMVQQRQADQQSQEQQSPL